MTDLFGDLPPQPRPQARRAQRAANVALDSAELKRAPASSPPTAEGHLRSGPAIGGPHEGKSIHHHAPVLWIAWRRGEEKKGPITYAGPETDEIYYHRYCWNGEGWVYE